MAAQNDITIYKGEDVVQPFHQVVEGTTTDVNIAGWTITLTVRTTPTATQTLLSKAASITNASQGRYQFHLAHADTVALHASAYHYDVQRTDGGSEAVLSIGRLTVTQEVLYP